MKEHPDKFDPRVEHLDEGVGKVMDGISAAGIEDNTIVRHRTWLLEQSGLTPYIAKKERLIVSPSSG